MKKLYFLDNEEKNRILNLHESLKPKSFINEQAATNVMTDQDLLGSTNRFRSYVQTLNDFNVLYKPLGLSPVDFLAGRRIGVKGVVDALDGWVDEKDLGYVLNVLNGLKGKCYSNDAVTPPVLIPAMKRFLELYKEDEGEDLISDVKSVGTTTLPTGSEKLKAQILNVINTYSAQSCAGTPKPKVDGGKTGGGKTGGGKTGGGKTSGGGSNVGQRLQATQKSLGLQGNGQLDVASLQAMLAKLNGGEQTARPQVEPLQPMTPAGVVQQPQQIGMSSDQLNTAIKQLQANANRPQ